MVVDCNFLNVGGSPDPSIKIDEGGGYFEERWNPAGHRPSAVGVAIHSPKTALPPSKLSIIKPAHSEIADRAEWAW
jgi:hypothetical protein